MQTRTEPDAAARDGRAGGQPELRTRLELYRLQVRLRQFEQRAYDLFLQNLVKGTSHLALGQEAIAAAFGLQFAHGLGLGLHERPIISRLNSLEHPLELQAGMVFAMETYCPAADGISAARIEEEVVVTDYGTEILTKFPAQDLFIANKY